MDPSPPRSVQPPNDTDRALTGAKFGQSLAIPYAWARAVAFLIIGILVCTLPDLSDRLALAGVALVGALAQPLFAKIRPADIEVQHAVFDLLMMAALATLEPALWHAGNLIALSSLTWLGVRLPLRRYVPVAGLGVLALTVVGGSQSAPAWQATSVAGVLFLAIFGWRGNYLRRSRDASHDDLQRALVSSGSIVHHSILSKNRVGWVQGPVEELTGWTAKEWVEMDHREILHPDDADYWVDPAGLVADQVIDRTGRFRDPEGNYRWIRDLARVVITPSGEVQLRGFTINVTEIEEANEYIREQARRDQLTGLPNRFELERQLEELQAQGRAHALLVLDMNRFKEINDTLGHHSGDQVLCQLGTRLRETTRDDDLVCRLGGDEFAVVLRSAVTPAQAISSAERVSEVCNRPYVLNQLTVVAPVSIGIAMSDGHESSGGEPAAGVEASEDLDDLSSKIGTALRRADIAMYEAKRLGANHVVFSDDLELVSVDQLALTASIAGALERHEFVLHFQPKVDLLSGRVVAVEGLARWQHPKRGVLPPGAFLDLVTLSNSYQEFTDQVLDLGAKFVAQSRGVGLDLPVAVNISVRSLHDPDFVTRFAQIVARHGIAPMDLVLEVTEQDLHTESEGSAQVLRDLSAIGVQLSIDDFGTGFSSLQRLRDLDVNELKIDRSFVTDLNRSDRDQIFAQTIIELAARLGHRVVAEGVETAEERLALTSLGCTVAQGYLFSAALPPERLLNALINDPQSLSGSVVETAWSSSGSGWTSGGLARYFSDPS